MSDQVTFRILRDIYNILSYAHANELRAASSDEGLSPALSKAIRQLAEGAQKEALALQHQPKSGRSAPSAKKRSASDPILRTVLNSPKLATKAAISETAKLLNIKLQFGPKDGVARVRLKLIQSIQALPENERSAALRTLNGKDMKDIEGWLDVIKGK